VENGLIERSPEAHPSEGLYIDRTQSRDRLEVPVRVLNATCRDQKLTKGSPMAHCEPAMLVTPPEAEQPQNQNSTPNLEEG
jgi:hypothetical protein